jgi:hypothetical protein
MATLYLPLALISLWAPLADDETIRDQLENTMLLVRAVCLVSTRAISLDQATQYRDLMCQYLKDVKNLYQNGAYYTNHHNAIHIYDFILLFGPIYSWWCFHIEQMIGKLQNVNTNHHFGHLESTLTEKMWKESHLRLWLGTPNHSAEMEDFLAIFNKTFESVSCADSVDIPRSISIDLDLTSANDVLEEDIEMNCVADMPDVDNVLRGNCELPTKFAKLMDTPPTGSVRFITRYKLRSVYYSISRHHVGNSSVIYFGDDQRVVQYSGVIQHIFTPGEEVYFILRRDCALPKDDVFTPYRPEFPAFCYSTCTSYPTYDIVLASSIICHAARFRSNDDSVVVVSLLKNI